MFPVSSPSTNRCSQCGSRPTCTTWESLAACAPVTGTAHAQPGQRCLHTHGHVHTFLSRKPQGRGWGIHRAVVEGSTLLSLLLVALLVWLFEDAILRCLASHRINVVPIPNVVWSRCLVCSGFHPSPAEGRPRIQASRLLNSHCGQYVLKSKTTAPVSTSIVSTNYNTSSKPASLPKSLYGLEELGHMAGRIILRFQSY